MNNSGKWITKAALSTGRSHPAVAVYQGKIYSFGGGGTNFKSLNNAEVYDPASDIWSALSPMPTMRSGAAAMTIGDTIAVMGGGYKKPDGRFKFLTTVEIYDPKKDRWQTGPSLLQPHDYPACAFVDGMGYIIGGHHPDATEGGPQTDPAFSFSERWNGKSDHWEEIALMPTPRFAASAVEVNRQLWVMGGVAAASGGFHEYDRIEIYDPLAGKWKRSENALPWPSAGQGSCILKEQLYHFGGFREAVGIGKHGAVAALSNLRWSELPPMPVDRAAMGLAILDESIYLIGGWRADRSVKDSVVAFIPNQ